MAPRPPRTQAVLSKPDKKKTCRYNEHEWDTIERLMQEEGITEDYSRVSRRAFAALARQHGLTWPSEI